MKICVVVVWEVGKLLFIEEVDLEGFKVGEVMVKLVVIGVCYMDVYILSGVDLEGLFFCIMGYEGVGEVVEIGVGVISVVVGDYVIFFYMSECGKCKFCLFGKINLCQVI